MAKSRKGKKGKIRVLVMDDEQMVLDLMRRMLAILGHECAVTASGEEAVRAYVDSLESGSPYDIVILDKNVKKGMGGEEAFEMIRAADPEAAGVISSGDDPSRVSAGRLSSGIRGVLLKPFTVKDLKDCIELALPAAQQPVKE